MAYLILFLLGGSSLQYVLLRKENAKRRAGKRNVWVDGKSATEIDALGDKRFVWLVLFLGKYYTLLTLTQTWIHLHALECLLMLPSPLPVYIPLMSLYLFRILFSRLKM